MARTLVYKNRGGTKLQKKEKHRIRVCLVTTTNNNNHHHHHEKACVTRQAHGKKSTKKEPTTQAEQFHRQGAAFISRAQVYTTHGNKNRRIARRSHGNTPTSKMLSDAETLRSEARLVCLDKLGAVVLPVRDDAIVPILRRKRGSMAWDGKCRDFRMSADAATHKETHFLFYCRTHCIRAVGTHPRTQTTAVMKKKDAGCHHTSVFVESGG